MSRPAWRQRGRLATVATSAALLSAVLAGCSSSGGANTLVLYNGQHTQTTDALVRAFEHDTGITVDVRSNDEDVLAEQILQEGGHSPADLIFTENSPALEFLQDHHLLARVDPSTLAEVPKADDSPNGDWVGVTARVSVLVYNTSIVKKTEVPTSVLDLADAKWMGKLAIAPQETDFQPIVTAVAQADGKQAALAWLRSVKANGAAHTYADNETITSSVNSGQAAIGIINQYYWYRLRAEIGAAQMHSAIAFLAPHNPGYVEDISGAGILAGSTHQADAQRFLAFMVSKQGQEIIAHSDSFEYPLHRGVAPADSQPPLSSLRPYPITVAELGDGSAAIALMREAGLIA